MVYGQVVKSEKLAGQNNIINISDLTKGMYIVKVAYKDGQYQMKKLIVK
ncbi:MAG: T9SS type A sorting domain-containing protein [Bacteroidales bacterium]|nr:T9SS type A sorting domain-containing protein [Bacteroidales bacterium]